MKSPPTTLRARLQGIRTILMAHHSAGSQLPSAAKGSEREVLVREFLAKVFPPVFRFGTGAMVDSRGHSSGQLDVVIEFPLLPSFPTPGAPDRLYLVESAAAVLEVKSDLAAQWKQVIRSAAKVRSLKRNGASHQSVNPSGTVSAFGPTESRVPFLAIGYCGPAKGERLQHMLNQCKPTERPDALLVIESGAYSGCDLAGQTQPSSGPAGLLSFTNDLAWLIRNVTTASPNVGSYLPQLQ
jgi:hypothetical protein